MSHRSSKINPLLLVFPARNLSFLTLDFNFSTHDSLDPPPYDLNITLPPPPYPGLHFPSTAVGVASASLFDTLVLLRPRSMESLM